MKYSVAIMALAIPACGLHAAWAQEPGKAARHRRRPAWRRSPGPARRSGIRLEGHPGADGAWAHRYLRIVGLVDASGRPGRRTLCRCRGSRRHAHRRGLRRTRALAAGPVRRRASAERRVLADAGAHRRLAHAPRLAACRRRIGTHRPRRNARARGAGVRRAGSDSAARPAGRNVVRSLHVPARAHRAHDADIDPDGTLLGLPPRASGSRCRTPSRRAIRHPRTRTSCASTNGSRGSA